MYDDFKSMPLRLRIQTISRIRKRLSNAYQVRVFWPLDRMSKTKPYYPSHPWQFKANFRNGAGIGWSTPYGSRSHAVRAFGYKTKNGMRRGVYSPRCDKYLGYLSETVRKNKKSIR